VPRFKTCHTPTSLGVGDQAALRIPLVVISAAVPARLCNIYLCLARPVCAEKLFFCCFSFPFVFHQAHRHTQRHRLIGGNAVSSRLPTRASQGGIGRRATEGSVARKQTSESWPRTKNAKPLLKTTFSLAFWIAYPCTRRAALVLFNDTTIKLLHIMINPLKRFFQRFTQPKNTGNASTAGGWTIPDHKSSNHIREIRILNGHTDIIRSLLPIDQHRFV
jgi:hypothetical protein